MRVWEIGGVMTRRGDTLRVETAGNAVPSSLRKAIRANKAALLSVITERDDSEVGQKKPEPPQESRHQSRHSD